MLCEDSTLRVFLSLTCKCKHSHRSRVMVSCGPLCACRLVCFGACTRTCFVVAHHCVSPKQYVAFHCSCRQRIVNMLHGFSSIVLAGDAATPPRCHASSFTKNETTGARVTEAVSPSTSTSGASTAASSECGTTHPKRRRLTIKQSPDAAWQKPLALPEQLPVIDTYLSEGNRKMYQRWWLLYNR